MMSEKECIPSAITAVLFETSPAVILKMARKRFPHAPIDAALFALVNLMSSCMPRLLTCKI